MKQILNAGWYGLNVCVPSKFLCWNPNCQSDDIRKWVFGRWLSREGEALMNRISTLQESPNFSYPLFAMWGYKETLSATGKRVRTGIWPCWHPDRGFPASETVRNKSMVKSPGLWYFGIQPNWTTILKEVFRISPVNELGTSVNSYFIPIIQLCFSDINSYFIFLTIIYFHYHNTSYGRPVVLP